MLKYSKQKLKRSRTRIDIVLLCDIAKHSFFRENISALFSRSRCCSSSVEANFLWQPKSRMDQSL